VHKSGFRPGVPTRNSIRTGWSLKGVFLRVANNLTSIASRQSITVNHRHNRPIERNATAAANLDAETDLFERRLKTSTPPASSRLQQTGERSV
jgi:hypothetical protein